MAVAPVRSGFWLQHASNEAHQLVAFADELGQTPAGRPGIAFGPVNVPKTLSNLFEQARQVGPAILDPHGHALDREPTRRAAEHFPWLVRRPRPARQDEWEGWMQEGLDHQLSRALIGTGSPPSFLVTPSPVVEASRGLDELYAVLDAAEAVASRQPGSIDVWLSISVDRTYLREEPHLTRLANAMLAVDARGFVFRASHQELPPVEDRRYLRGLREVVEACAENRVPIYLPNSGWLGWLAMAWGGWGFSGGMAGTTWVDRIPTPMTRPDNPTLPYFEPQLVRTVPWRDHQALVNDPAYQPCTCPDCDQMGSAYDISLAKRHQLRHANTEAAALVSTALPQRRVSVANRLDQAITFYDGLSDALKRRVEADFLDRWRSLL